MPCTKCNSNNVMNLKIHIKKPIGNKKMKCLDCNNVFITNNLVKPQIDSSNVNNNIQL